MAELMTPADYHSIFNHTRESTSLHPPLHYGHFKAACESTILTELNLAFMNIHFQYEYPLTRWLKSYHCMLQKKKQPWIHKLRIVSLMEHYASEDLEPIIEMLLIIGKPESHLLQLLDLICENFPPYAIEQEIPDHVKITCPCQEIHDVSPFGFQLLEKVERRTDTCLQQVDIIRMFMC